MGTSRSPSVNPHGRAHARYSSTAPAGCRLVLPVCYRHIVQLGDTTTNYQIMPGDRVFVATRSCQDSINPFRRKQDCPLCCGPQCACGSHDHAPAVTLAARKPQLAGKATVKPSEPATANPLPVAGEFKLGITPEKF